MKHIILVVSIWLYTFSAAFAQPSPSVTHVGNLPVVNISNFSNIQFLSPEAITFVDITGFRLQGDLPVKNVLRLKTAADSVKGAVPGTDLGVVTITGQSFIAQYRVLYGRSIEASTSEIQITPDVSHPLDVSGVSLTDNQLKMLGLRVLAQSKGMVAKSSAYGITIALRGIYTAGDFVFFDVELKNDSNLPFEPDEIRFKIDDRKINKATNVQSVELTPHWQLYPLSRFSSRYHNVYVLKKATFPDHKVLSIELSEKQLSGRHAKLSVSYKAVLQADTL